MKKTMKWLGALALMMMCAFSFTACGDDDDDPNPSGSTDSGSLTLQDMLVGNAWYIVYESSDVVEVELYLFNSNGKADAAELERSSDDGFTTTQADRFTVNYSIAGNRLTIIESDGDTRVAQLDITNGTSTTMRPVKSNGTLGDAETIYLLAKGKTADQLVEEGLIEQLMDRLTAERRQGGSNVADGRSLVGKWNLVFWQEYRNGEWSDRVQTAPYDMIVFTEDGKWEYWEYDGHESENRRDDRERVFGNNYYHEDGSGTWKQEGSKITFTSDEVVSAEFLSYDGTGNAQLSVNFGGKICIYKMERVQ
ncbi:MAG: hypothetical protein IJ064_00475 [Bacteroidaceae bacterium]|nr:hypothetical protein [Bacteroidaceae bacterium]